MYMSDPQVEQSVFTVAEVWAGWNVEQSAMYMSHPQVEQSVFTVAEVCGRVECGTVSNVHE